MGAAVGSPYLLVAGGGGGGTALEGPGLVLGRSGCGVRMHRQYSLRSEDAFKTLEELNGLLTEKETRFAAIVARVAEDPPKEELIGIKNELALMNGA